MSVNITFWIIALFLHRHVIKGCPIINIDHTESSDGGQQTKITTIVQGDQIKEIFENVSSVLLNAADTRFMKFLELNDVPSLPVDCQDIRTTGHSTSGVYTIYPKGSFDGFPVLCDMKTENGGWTVIQRRVNGSVDFHRTWNEYQTGFGNAEHEYWLGNQQIHLLTSHAWYEILFDMVGPDGDVRHVRCDVFKVGDVESGYKLTVDGMHGDTDMTDDLKYHSGSKFSTYDRDQDGSGRYNCASSYKGGWWYNSCHNVNLNGKYGQPIGSSQGIHWKSWTTVLKSMTFVEMKIRRYQKK